MLSQLRYMIPSTERPVRAESVAAFVFEVLRQWPVVWAAAQAAGPREVVARWLKPDVTETF